MTAESRFTSDESGMSPGQKSLEAEANTRVDSERRLRDITTTLPPNVSQRTLIPIVTAINYKLALSWQSRVKDIRDLHLVSSSTTEVIYGSLQTGQEIFLSSKSNLFGFRRGVFGVIGCDQVEKRVARKLFRRYSSPLKRRNQLMARGS